MKGKQDSMKRKTRNTRTNDQIAKENKIGKEDKKYKEDKIDRADKIDN